jgi:hypothetical protein
MFSHSQGIVLLIEVGVIAGVQFLTWVGVHRRTP